MLGRMGEAGVAAIVIANAFANALAVVLAIITLANAASLVDVGALAPNIALVNAN